MITIENLGNKIYVFGRNEKGVLQTSLIEDFRPYFYVQNPQGTIKSIDGEKVSKIIVESPELVVQERKKYSKTYEADVKYVNRYIIDNFKKIEKESIRICYMDIEIAKTEKGFESIGSANNPILMIGCYDNFEKKAVDFVLYKTHQTEKELVAAFMRYIKEKDFDMLVAWNGEGFDFPFLINRIKKLRLNPNFLNRNGGYCTTRKLNNGFYATHIWGRTCFDLMEAYKKMNSYGGRESWSLDYISKYEKVGEKEKYKGNLDDLFKTDIEKFIAYNRKDVELLKLLDEKLQIINFFDELRRLCFCKFEDVFMNSKMADCLCLKYAKDNGFVLPSCKDNIKEEFEGAFVHDSEPKLHENIAWFDMKSLYPSVIIGFNISPETIMEDMGEILSCHVPNTAIAIDDKYFFRKEQGMIPAIIKPLLDKRKEYKDIYLTQYALKVVANSFYGVLGMKYFRLYNNDCASAVTYISRRVIKEVHKWWEDRGYKVIYGDTDSCAIEMKEGDIDEMIKLNKEINLHFKEYFKQFGVEEKNNIFKLEFEKVFRRVFFKRKADGEGAKKKYAGRVVFEDGKLCDKFVVVGFESRRSDSPDVGRQFMNDVLKMICYEQSEETIRKFIEDFKEIIVTDFTPEEIGLPISITKPLDKYANQIHARAARLANKKHNSQIKQGDKIKYIYLKENDNVIAWKSDGFMPEGYIIDYDKMIVRIVDLKIGPLFESLGWKYDYLEVKKIKKEKVIKEKKVREKFYPEFKQRSLF